jgi:predicted RND superfamily exporter protein
MAVLGIGLSPGTIMIGAIALGLVVDDTVHFLVSLRRELARDPDLDAAITATFRTSGRPIILTSVILMAGFAVMMVGSFNPSIQFGAVSALVIGYALLADLLLLPAALRVMRPNVSRT